MLDSSFFWVWTYPQVEANALQPAQALAPYVFDQRGLLLLLMYYKVEDFSWILETYAQNKVYYHVEGLPLVSTFSSGGLENKHFQSQSFS